MAYSKQRLREVAALQRKAVERIQSEIGEIHPSPSRKYIEKFSQEFDAFDSVCSREEMLRDAVDANLVWLGDYHALEKSQLYVVELLEEMSRRKEHIALAVEPIFARSQQVLDRWMAGKISEPEFLDRIRYYEEWGCAWSGFKAIFQAARELRIPVYGVDCHPRNDMRSIGRRDLGVARQIARLMENNRGRTVGVIFGDT